MIIPRLQEARSALHRRFRKRRLRPQDLPPTEGSKKPETTDVVTNPGYQDANRHPEALEIARDLCRRDPDEQRYALKRFFSCQALGLTAEMREIVDDLQGRRRPLFETAL